MTVQLPSFATHYYCSRHGWLEHADAVEGEDGAKRCPKCNLKLRTKPRSRMNPEKVAEWRRNQ